MIITKNLKNYLIIFLIIISNFDCSYSNKIICNSKYSKYSIQQSINSLKSYDTLVLEGYFEETNINISKPLLITSNNNATIDAGKSASIFILTSPNCQINGLTLKNVKISQISDNAAIKIEAVNNIKITNNKILNCFFGMYFKHSKFSIIENNYILGAAMSEFTSGNAIHLWYCDSMQIRN